MDVWMHGCIDAWMCVWMYVYGCMYEYMVYVCMNVSMDGVCMDVWMYV